MALCRAVVQVGGKVYPCELEAPHKGTAHENQEADAAWCSHGEAVFAARSRAEANG